MTNHRPLILFFTSFLVVEVINSLLSRMLNQFGLIPRDANALLGIIFSPWLHGNTQHFLANIGALIILGLACYQWGKATFWKSTLIIIVCSGLAVWVVGRSALHIGASGLVYGYFGFSVLAGWLAKRFIYLLVSVAIAILYGSMAWGLLPLQNQVSFEYHIMGCISGLIAAKLYAK